MRVPFESAELLPSFFWCKFQNVARHQYHLGKEPNNFCEALDEHSLAIELARTLHYQLDLGKHLLDEPGQVGNAGNDLKDYSGKLDYDGNDHQAHSDNKGVQRESDRNNSNHEQNRFHSSARNHVLKHRAEHVLERYECQFDGIS